MKFIDLTIPLGIGTPPWPTYEPLQVKYFKRLAPNGANGQVVTHSNHVGTHLDGEIHFYTPGKDIAGLDFDFLTGDAAIVDLSDCCGDYDVYTPEMIEDRVEVRERDILIIHTGYHHFGWDQPYGNEVRYMVMHPGPDARRDRIPERGGRTDPDPEPAPGRQEDGSEKGNTQGNGDQEQTPVQDEEPQVVPVPVSSRPSKPFAHEG